MSGKKSGGGGALNPLAMLSGGGLPSLSGGDGGAAGASAYGGSSDQWLQRNAPFNVAGSGASASSSGGLTGSRGVGSNDAIFLVLAAVAVVGLLVVLKS